MDTKTTRNLGQEIISEYQTLAASRTNWDSHWQEIAERLIPSHKDLFTQKGSTFTGGDKKTQKVFDSTASIALSRFAAILDSLLTPRSQTWHRVLASDPSLNRIRDVRLWFDEVNRLLFKYRYAPKANFASQNQSNYTSLGAYGSGCVFVDPLAGEPGIRYRNIHLSEIYFAENHQGIVDKIIRYFPLKQRQAVQAFGDLLPRKIKEAKNPDEDFFFLHCVKPRLDRDPRRVDALAMPFASYYVSMDEEKILRESGYRVFPYATSRYQQTPGEVYGRSPAMDVLPAVKTLNEEKKTFLKQGHRTVDPVLLVHDDGVLDSPSMKPGAVNFGGVSADGRPLVHTLPVGNLAISKEMMDDERVVINDAFLITIFQIMTENPQMSATEVLERTKEKGILLAPTIGRQQSEYLGPMIEREIDVLVAQNLLPPMPRQLIEARGDYRIEYDSPLSQAQRAGEASGLFRTVEQALQVVNVTQNPEPLDFFDWDTIIPEISEIQGVPARWMRSMEQVTQMRQQRQQQMDQQQAIQAGPSAAALMKAGAAVKGQG